MPGLSSLLSPLPKTIASPIAPALQEHGRAASSIDIETAPSPLPTSAPPPRANRLQLGFQEDRINRLNATHHDMVMSTSHRPIPDAKMARIRQINCTLQTLGHALRNRQAQTYLSELYDALGANEKAVARELMREALTLQAPGSLNNAIGLGPTLLGSLVPGIPAAAGAFAWATAAQVYQPWLGVQIFNAAYFSFDFSRKAGMPGRSRQLESAQTLLQTSSQLHATNDTLDTALDAAGKSAPGTAAARAELRALVKARDASTQALENRMRREALDDSFDAGRWAQSTLSALKQLAFFLSQYIAYANNRDCNGGKLSFYVQMGTVAVIQLLQLLAAPTDRVREGKRILAANLAYGQIDSKNDVRDMFRSPYVQKLWLVGDGIETRTNAKLTALARQFNVSERRLKKFEEAGGFNQTTFATPLDDDARNRWTAFQGLCEGPPLAGCHGAQEELEKLEVLEDLGRLQLLEDLGQLGVLTALHQAHAPRAAGAAAPYLPSTDEIRRHTGVASDEAADALRDAALPDDLAGQLAALQARYATDPALVEHVRVTLRIAATEAAAMLQAPAPDADGILSGTLTRSLLALQKNYASDAPYELLQATLGLPSIDAARALRQAPLPADLRADLADLQSKYETRTLLTPDALIHHSRAEMLGYAELARASGAVLTPGTLAVRARLEAKSRTSTLNIHGWRHPLASSAPEEDQARREQSLTPFEHTLLHTLRVLPRIDAAASAKAGRPVTDHELLAATLPGAPASMAQVRQLLKELREHRLDKAIMPWDYTQLTPETTRSIANVLQGDRSLLGNAKDAITARWNMPGYLVPVIVVQLARATFMAIGGSGFFFFLQAAAGLARKARPDIFNCKPGEGPNDAANQFAYVMMGVSVAMLAFAVLGAWGGPQAVNAARMRFGYFTRLLGRPNFVEMMRENYLYSARRAVTDYAAERLFTGPAAKKRNAELVARANQQIAALGRRTAAITDQPGSGMELALVKSGASTATVSPHPAARPAPGLDDITEIV